MSDEKKDSIQEERGTTTEDKYAIGGPDSFGMYFLKLDGGGRLPKEHEGSRWTDLKEIEMVVNKLNN